MKIETKFNQGDTVWTIFNNRITAIWVSTIEIRIYADIVHLDYHLTTENINDDVFMCDEKYIFASKAELLEFWAK